MNPALAQRYWLFRFVSGLLLLLVGGNGGPTGLLNLWAGRGNWFLADVACGLFGFWLALTSVSPLIKLMVQHGQLRAEWGRERHDAFERASLPRQIYYLLVAVAEADGPLTPVEREAVREFLLQRFADPVSADDLRAFAATPLPTRDLRALAARVSRGLDPAERDSLFCWCCLVCFADGTFRDPEHQALQHTARGLGITPQRARMLFHLARAQYLRRQQQAGGRKEAPHVDVSSRAQALSVLGLPTDATPEMIRRRHRELVRRFHPDAQPNLGEVALREATERFRAIQGAYEVLSS